MDGKIDCDVHHAMLCVYSCVLYIIPYCYRLTLLPPRTLPLTKLSSALHWVNNFVSVTNIKSTNEVINGPVSLHRITTNWWGVGGGNSWINIKKDKLRTFEGCGLSLRRNKRQSVIQVSTRDQVRSNFF